MSIVSATLSLFFDIIPFIKSPDGDAQLDKTIADIRSMHNTKISLFFIKIPP